ncbi:MAG: tetratricopeptide repeat protein, partial [Saprospiraceae bacterium]
MWRYNTSKQATMRSQIQFFLFIIIINLVSCVPDKQEPTPIFPVGTNPAIIRLSEEIGKNPTDIKLYIQRAMLLYSEEDYDAAIKDAKVILASDSSNLDYRHLLADIYFDGDRDAEAIQMLEGTLEIFPASERTLLKLSEYQYILDLYDPALKTISTLMETKPNHVDGYYMQGRILGAKGDLVKAEQSFKAALKEDPKHFDTLLELGTLLNNQEKKEALKYLKSAMMLSNNTPEVLFEMGNYYHSNNKLDEALEYFKQATLLDSHFTEGYINAGIVWLEKKDIPKAWDFFNMAVNVDPTYPEAYYYRGVASTYKGKPEDARADYQQALQL